MSQNPLNLALRFALELAALFAYGYWGWTQHTGLMQVVWGLGLPIVAASIWGVFRVPEDHGKGLLAVTGPVRLVTELTVFSLAVALYAVAGRDTAASIMGLLVALHYMLSYDRVLWLLRN